jgi:two-component system sensor histidine kinase CreC
MRFTRVTLFFIAFIIALGFYHLASHFLAEVEPQTFQATEESMVDSAHLFAEIAEPYLENESRDFTTLRSAFSEAHQRRFNALIFEHEKISVGLHLYVTDTTGRVLFDTDGGRREGLDYSQRRDVSLTLKGRYGARSSKDFLDEDSPSVLYVAAPVGDPENPIGVVTVFKPKIDVLPLVRERRRIIYTACGLIGGGIAFLIGAVFLWLFRPIGRITEYARAIERGERPAKPKIGIGREVNTLAHALDSMCDALENRNYVERYVQTLTHELKSPLAGIRGAAELLLEEMPPEAREKFLNNILAETSRSERLINRLLELSAIESRRSLDSYSEIEITSLIHEAIQQTQPAADLRNVSISFTNHSTTTHLRGDRWILRCALVNLLENAIDFSPPGTTVLVEMHSNGPNLTIEIRDQGPGIPDYALAKVFDRFFSLRHPATQRKGTGLGLTLVREAAELHGGSVTIECPASGGTTARLLLPA